jgi:hypothetical protein
LVRFPRATRFLSFDVALAALEPGFAAVADADADADERRLATQLDIGSEAAAPSAERLSSAKTGRGRRGETLGLGFWGGGRWRVGWRRRGLSACFAVQTESGLGRTRGKGTKRRLS